MRAIAPQRWPPCAGGLDLGMNHIDTAEMYGDAEVIVGEAIDGRRDEVFLVSKILPQNASLRGTIVACERSLSRLQTDHLDCYLLHWRGPHPLEVTFTVFEELRRSGKILSWGVSNFDEPDLDEVLEIVGERRLACDQVLYHLEERAIEHAVLPRCEQQGLAVVAYSPFGHGHFPAPTPRAGASCIRSRRPTARPRPSCVAVFGPASLGVRDPEGL